MKFERRYWDSDCFLGWLQAEDDKIDPCRQVTDFFKRSYIIPMSITRRIAEDSRELVWDHGIEPKDALHVATAIKAKVDVFNTFDKPLIRKSLQVGDPKLPIEAPTVAQRDLGV